MGNAEVSLLPFVRTPRGRRRVGIDVGGLEDAGGSHQILYILTQDLSEREKDKI